VTTEANKALWRRFYEEGRDRGNTDFAYEGGRPMHAGAAPDA
jgi:hypothetical protein